MCTHVCIRFHTDTREIIEHQHIQCIRVAILVEFRWIVARVLGTAVLVVDTQFKVLVIAVGALDENRSWGWDSIMIMGIWALHKTALSEHKSFESFYDLSY